MTTEGCDCSAAINYMAKRGAPHASRMKRSGIPESLWPLSDLFMHFGEEEVWFFPNVPLRIRVVLLRHHEQFRRELRQYGRIVDTKLFSKHAAIENVWAKKLLAKMV